MQDRDTIRRFLFEDVAVRGEVVHLDATWRAVLERRPYPEPVARLLGEAMVAAALLAATVKFEGLLTLQLKGPGCVRLLVVQCTPSGQLRGLARWEGEAVAGSLGTLCAGATLVITIDVGRGSEPYQGVVSLEGDSLSSALNAYFQRSEQLPTRFVLGADGRRAAGLMLQRVPGRDADAEAWERIAQRGGALSGAALLGLDVEALLRRLFPEDDLRLFEAQALVFRCTCSRERTGAVLRALGLEEVRSILREQGEVRVSCEFCGAAHVFDAVDAEGLFARPSVSDPSTTRH